MYRTNSHRPCKDAEWSRVEISRLEGPFKYIKQPALCETSLTASMGAGNYFLIKEMGVPLLGNYCESSRMSLSSFASHSCYFYISVLTGARDSVH